MFQSRKVVTNAKFGPAKIRSNLILDVKNHKITKDATKKIVINQQGLLIAHFKL
jgi:hypothetical protein